MTAPKPFDRILARRVIYRGHIYGLSLVELFDTEVRISPFEAETHSTRFVDGTIEITHTPDGRPTLLTRN